MTGRGMEGPRRDRAGSPTDREAPERRVRARRVTGGEAPRETRAARATRAAPAKRGATDQEPDVLLDVPDLAVDEIDLDVENLRARVSLQAEVGDLLRLNVGADVDLGAVSLTLRGVEAQARLKVRLDNVAAIIERVLRTIDENPQLITEGLAGPLKSAVAEAGNVAGRATDAVGRGAGQAAAGGLGALAGGDGNPAAPVTDAVGRAADAGGRAAEAGGRAAGPVGGAVTGGAAGPFASPEAAGGGSRPPAGSGGTREQPEDTGAAAPATPLAAESAAADAVWGYPGDEPPPEDADLDTEAPDSDAFTVYDDTGPAGADAEAPPEDIDASAGGNDAGPADTPPPAPADRSGGGRTAPGSPDPGLDYDAGPAFGRDADDESGAGDDSGGDGGRQETGSPLRGAPRPRRADHGAGRGSRDERPDGAEPHPTASQRVLRGIRGVRAGARQVGRDAGSVVSRAVQAAREAR
ncbi:hypothetical protein LG943_24410 [Streptomonospora sp. S1-112]|uniref:Uncharacterized protein n=1 Tax=Streptomonospora mangrovi TaxID=2883123 RepID=A0A9X3P084_9ACTN|nr:hypothetical protein [Streptomonospora mangrovi]MDA0567441.1 hypothetical protein [Streptomonospora mangrovi]